MKILYVHRTQGKGVEAVHINEMIKEFKVLGHEVKVLSPIDENSNSVDCNKTETKSKASGLSLISKYIPEFIFELLEIAYNLISWKKLKKIHNQYKFDVIYERYAIFSFFTAGMKSKFKYKLIMEVNYTASMDLVRIRSKFLLPLAKYVDKFVLQKADKIIVVSSYLKKHLVNDYLIDDAKIIVLPNAADPSKFKFINYAEYSENTKYIGFVGGFYPWHGVDLLVEAFNNIKNQYPDTKLMLIGDGPERRNIEDMVNQYNIQDKVIFTGKIQHDELSNYVSKFYLGVMPDSNVYGSPMKIFEYMAMGVPVVAPDYAPIHDSMDSDVEGIIFKKNNIKSLQDAFCTILNDENLRSIMSYSAREKVVNDRNWNNNAVLSLDGLID